MAKSLRIGFITLGISLLLSCMVTAQEYTVSGYIKDKDNGEKLPFATVYDIASQRGATSNEYGFFSINVGQGKRMFIISYLGYNDKRIELQVDGDKRIDFELVSENLQLDEVVLTASEKESFLQSKVLGVNKLSPARIKEIPQVLGEADVLRALQLLPGVTTASEGSAGFNVRGGSADQNLVQLDEAVVFNTSHLFGFFSVFNPDAIKNVTLYKGGIPAQYGGRLSSVLDIYSKEGNRKKFSANGGIGLLSSRLTLETPLFKGNNEEGKGSLLLSGRRSYADLFLALSSDEQLNRNVLFFYDFNAKANLSLSENDILYVSGYFGRDRLEVADSFETGWGNLTGTLRWNHSGKKYFANTSFIYSNYDYELAFLINNGFRWESNLESLNLKSDLDFFLNENVTLKTGYLGSIQNFNPGEIRPGDSESPIIPTDFRTNKAIENNVYISINYKLSPKLKLTAGLRGLNYSRVGRDTINIYRNDSPLIYNELSGNYEAGELVDEVFYDRGDFFESQYFIEPRFSAKYKVDNSKSIQLGYNRLHQNVHLISNTTSVTPLDIYLPSGPYLEPQRSDQVSAGYFQQLNNDTYEFSVETYYKWLDNQYDFIDGASILFENNPETILLQGDGRAYGVEFLFKKNKGDFTGWLSYTLSKSERRIGGVDGGPGINNGEYYNANYDKPHNISLVGSYRLNDLMSISANFIYQTGRPITYPVAKYTYLGLLAPNYVTRNQDRLPDNHRLDVGLTLEGKKREKYQSRWIFGIYNLYARQNPSTVFFREQTVDGDDSLGTGVSEAVELSYFGIVPSVTWEFKF